MLRGGDICGCVLVAARVREIPAVASLNERREKRGRRMTSSRPWGEMHGGGINPSCLQDISKQTKESVCMRKEWRYLQRDEAFQQECGSDDLINGQRCPVAASSLSCPSVVSANLRHFSQPNFPSPIRYIFGYPNSSF